MGGFPFFGGGFPFFLLGGGRNSPLSGLYATLDGGDDNDDDNDDDGNI